MAIGSSNSNGYRAEEKKRSWVNKAMGEGGATLAVAVSVHMTDCMGVINRVQIVSARVSRVQIFTGGSFTRASCEVDL